LFPALITFNELLDFREVWNGGRATEGDLCIMHFYPVASTISKTDVEASEVDVQLESVGEGLLHFLC
jgi:hypothetical protein